MNNASAQPEYRKARRIYDRAMIVLGHAERHLLNTCPNSFDDIDNYPAEAATTAALDLLAVACKTLNRELDIATKKAGVGVYQPYGGKYRPRRY